MNTCAKTGCARPAVSEPIVRVWDRAWARDDKSANFQLEGRGLCEGCKPAATVAELMPEALRNQIDASFAAAGKTVPDWSTAKVEWAPMATGAVELQTASGGRGPC